MFVERDPKMNEAGRDVVPSSNRAVGLCFQTHQVGSTDTRSAEAKVLFGLANDFRLRTDQRDTDGLWPTHGEGTERLRESFCGRKIRWLASPTAATRQTAGISGARIRRLLQ